ncbi:MAG: hypothetical protein WBX01_14200 [Nitrososphaeraceae archaeon]|jgi:hypothetical protein
MDKLTPNQRRVLNLIDCAAELNPEIDERPDVLNELDPNSFNNLKPIIEDTSMHFLFRRNALDLYIRRKEEESKDYISDLIWDRDLAPTVFRYITKYRELERYEDPIMMNDLPIEFKRSLLTQIAKSR